jgi:Ni,Fe-hydrogenase III small subunit
LDSAAKTESLVERCPTGAITRQDGGVAIDVRRCIHCARCRRGSDEAVVPWDVGYEWATHDSDAVDAAHALEKAFSRSLHIRFVDAGACGACVSEARQLNNPYYNMHRLGFFMTPTPRNADILLVSGPVSDAMRYPLRKAYDAMPVPKRVVAIGACAIFGGVFGSNFAAAGGASEIVPVDVVVPGCPPPPLAILHGLLLAVKRKPPSNPVSAATAPTGEPA